MTHFMEEKIKILEDYICMLEDAITKKDVGKAKELQTEIIAVYEPEIDSLVVSRVMRKIDSGIW